MLDPLTSTKYKLPWASTSIPLGPVTDVIMGTGPAGVNPAPACVTCIVTPWPPAEGVRTMLPDRVAPVLAENWNRNRFGPFCKLIVLPPESADNSVIQSAS